MNLRNLRVFLEVAKYGNMSKAAKELFLSQPAVSQIIRELEEYYDVLLFERISRKLFLTDAGKILKEKAEHVLREFDEMETQMRQINKKPTLHIGATLTVSTCSILTNCLSMISQELPDTEIYTYTGNTTTIESKLLNSELDLGLIEGTILNTTDLTAVPLVSDYLVLVCNMEHPLASQNRVSIESLSNYDFAMRETGSGTRSMIQSYLNAHDIPIKIRWETADIESLKIAVLEHGLITIASVRIFEQEIKSGKVKVFMNGNYDWDRTFNMVYPKREKMPNELSVIYKILVKYNKPEFLYNADYGIII